MSFEQDTSSIGDLEKNLTELGGDPGRTDRELDN